jgi:fibronectin type 3 domain-containing protein
MRVRVGLQLLIVCSLFCVSLLGCRGAEPRSVTLKWDPPQASPATSIAAYNIYRSTTSGNGYVRLASGVSGPPFEDRLVTSGRTYYYVVTALDSKGRESQFSREARAVIP